jgi:hypothetical protein
MTGSYINAAGQVVSNAPPDPSVISAVLASIAATPTTYTATPTFNAGINVGGPSASANFDQETPNFILRTDSPAGIVVGALEVDYKAAFTNSNVGVAGIFALVNTGGASGGVAPHFVGVVAYASDTGIGDMPIIGCEGRKDQLGLAGGDGGCAVLGIANQNGATLTGRTNVVFQAQFSNTSNGIGGTPLAQGTVIQFYAPAGQGGSTIYNLFGGGTGAILNGGTIYTALALGYTTGLGAGGAITQTGSRTNGVVINKCTGQITLVSGAGSATPTTFAVTNSLVAATDTIIATASNTTNVYEIFCNATSGGFYITFFTTGGTATESPVFNFCVIKGSNN